mgnify:FL=1
MNLKRCNNGHFYDADKFTSCPYCNPTVSASELTVAMDQAQLYGETGAPSEFDDEDGKTVSLQDAVSAAVNAPVDAKPDMDDNKTVSYYAQSMGADPVVGWLVCIEGSYFGESFKLKSGRNFIGRSSSMDVALTGDNSVSRERHAIVIYEPKARIFIAQPGDSRELFYLNDEVVLNNEKLKNYDVLTVGNLKLMLVACCGEHFSWDDVKKTEE